MKEVKGTDLEIEVVEEEVKTSDAFVLKELPEHLCYSFLRTDGKKLVIVSVALSKDDEAKLLVVLQKHQQAFAWSFSDIKGISPSVCMHEILMEDEYKPSVEHQRRLNLTIK